jgi:hypothetical protein
VEAEDLTGLPEPPFDGADSAGSDGPASESSARLSGPVLVVPRDVEGDRATIVVKTFLSCDATPAHSASSTLSRVMKLDAQTALSIPCTLVRGSSYGA